MNALTQIDRALKKATGLVEQFMLDTPGGIYISQLTGHLQIHTEVAKKALKALNAVEENGLWRLPSDEPVQAPIASPAPTSDEIKKTLPDRLADVLRAHPGGILRDELLRLSGVTMAQYPDAIKTVRKTMFPVISEVVNHHLTLCIDGGVKPAESASVAVNPPEFVEVQSVFIPNISTPSPEAVADPMPGPTLAESAWTTYFAENELKAETPLEPLKLETTTPQPIDQAPAELNQVAKALDKSLENHHNRDKKYVPTYTDRLDKVLRAHPDGISKLEILSRTGLSDRIFQSALKNIRAVHYKVWLLDAKGQQIYTTVDPDQKKAFKELEREPIMLPVPSFNCSLSWSDGRISIKVDNCDSFPLLDTVLQIIRDHSTTGGVL